MRVAFALSLLTATAAWAQVPPAAAETTVTSARSYTVEWAITAAVFGLALYEACRPGRRQQG